MGPMSWLHPGVPGRLGVAGSGGEYGWKLEGWDVRGTKKKAQHLLQGGSLVCIIVYSEYIHIYIL